MFLCLLLAVGCVSTDNPTSIDPSNDKLPQVIASTSIVADVVAQVGGGHIELTTLIPAGTDPHGFEPAPSDLIAIGQADMIFINGLHLEESLDSILESPDTQGAIISVNAGVETIELGDEDEHHGDEDEHHGDEDPHTWFSIEAVVQWVENVKAALTELDPANGEHYETNAQAYLAELDELSTELERLIAELPVDKRKLVTNHDSFGYFAAAYDFDLVGTIIPSLSTMASPTAGELVALQEQIEAEDVSAIFVGVVANPDLAEQLAMDIGIQIVTLYTGGLSDTEGPASSYLDFMRYNTKVIVDALK